MERRYIRIIPNALCIFRMALIPILGFASFFENRMLFAVLFLTAGLTDIIDGYIARKYKATTRQGQILDSIADYLLLYSSALWVYWLEPRIIDWWIAVLIMIAAIIAAEMIKGRKHKFARHDKAGKASSAISFFMILSLSLGFYNPVVFATYLFTMAALALMPARIKR